MSDFPPLKSLRAFAVAAKTLHFSEAGAQLHITQSAISHQIKNLEAYLGCKLFVRQSNKLQLTEQGKLLSTSVNSAFDQIQASCKVLRGELEQELQFGVSSAFAVHRITPELGEFMSRHNRVDLRLRMLTCGEDPGQLNLDILLLEQPIDHIAFDCQKIKAERYFAVATPTIATTLSNIPAELWHEQTKFIDLQGFDCWHSWFEQQGFDYTTTTTPLIFGNTLLMLQAALSSQGVALLGETLIKNELRQNKLVKLTETPWTVGEEGYYFCIHHKRRSDSNVRLVKNWLNALCS